jgi:hypothetical protein
MKKDFSGDADSHEEIFNQWNDLPPDAPKEICTRSLSAAFRGLLSAMNNCCFSHTNQSNFPNVWQLSLVFPILVSSYSE